MMDLWFNLYHDLRVIFYMNFVDKSMLMQDFPYIEAVPNIPGC